MPLAAAQGALSGLSYMSNLPMSVRVDRWFDDLHDCRHAEAVGHERHANIGNFLAAIGMMACDRPHDRAAPIVPDPQRLVAAERTQERQHVADDGLECVILVRGI